MSRASCLGFGLVAHVVPGDGGRHRLAVAVDEDAGLAHAGDPDAADDLARRGSHASSMAAKALSRSATGSTSTPCGPVYQGVAARPVPTGRPVSV